MDSSLENNPVEMILYRQYITYADLKKMIVNEYKDDSYSDTINVYIDLYQYLISALRYTKIENPFSISSAIINYAAHMRKYFRYNHKVYSNIIFVNSTNDSKNMYSYIPDYDVYYKNRIKHNIRMGEHVRSNMDLVRQLIPYIPNVFLVEGSVETSVIIHHLIKNAKFGRYPNIILSNSQLMFQLPQFSKSAVVIRKSIKRKTQDDYSYSFNANNCIQAYSYALSKKNVIGALNQQTISLIMALRGIPKRNIKPLFQFSTALNIAKLVPLGCEHDPNILGDIYVDYCKSKHKRNAASKESFINRFKGIDLGYQYKLYQLLPESKEESFLTQLDDKDSVHYINNYYFKDVPLQLEDL